MSAGNRLQGQRRHFNQRENNTDQHARKPHDFFFLSNGQKEKK